MHKSKSPSIEPLVIPLARSSSHVAADLLPAIGALPLPVSAPAGDAQRRATEIASEDVSRFLSSTNSWQMSTIVGQISLF
jgi:hypothetical protein